MVAAAATEKPIPMSSLETFGVSVATWVDYMPPP
jgi:hypothetical protein